MDDKSTIKVSGGLGFSGILTLILVVAKLIGYFPYSWWWVFAPIIITWGLAIVLVIFVVIAAIVASKFLDD